MFEAGLVFTFGLICCVGLLVVVNFDFVWFDVCVCLLLLTWVLQLVVRLLRLLLIWLTCWVCWFCGFDLLLVVDCLVVLNVYLLADFVG